MDRVGAGRPYDPRPAAGTTAARSAPTTGSSTRSGDAIDATATTASLPTLRSTWAGWARRTRLAVVAATVLWGLLGAWYAVAVPPLHAPDEFAHVDLVLHGPVLRSFDDYDGLTYDARIEAALPRAGLLQLDWRVAPRDPWAPGLRAEEIEPRGQRPSMDDLAAPGVGRGIRNPAGDHPPMAYWLLDVGDRVLDVTGSTPSWDAAVLRLRLVAVAVGLPTPLLAALLAGSVVPGDRRRREAVAVAAALCCSAVPQATHALASVNNDAPLLPLGALALVLAARVALGDVRWGTVVALGAVTGATNLVKVFGLTSPFWVAAAIAIAWRRGHLSSWRDAAVRLAAAGAAHVVAGGFWPLRQLVVEGTPAPRGFAYPVPADLATPVLPWLGEVARRMTTTTWGHFGVEQHPLPWALLVPATALALVLLAVGVGRLRGGLPVGLLVLLPVLGTAAMIGYAAWGGYVRTGIPSGLHGRYLFVGLAGLAVLAAVGLSRFVPPPGVVLAAGGAVAVHQAVAAAVLLDGYWAGAGLPESARTLLAWSPIASAAVVVTVVSAVAALVAAVVLGTKAHPAPPPAMMAGGDQPDGKHGSLGTTAAGGGPGR